MGHPQNNLYTAGLIIASSCFVSAATFNSDGTIVDAGNTVGNWAYTTNGTAGFNGVNEAFGANGIELAFQNDPTAGADTLAVQFTITAASGYTFDSLVISQSNYNSGGGDNGATATGADFSVLSYTGAFNANLGTGGQIANVAQGTDLTWELPNLGTATTPDFRSENAIDDWAITLTDVTSGGAISYQETSTENVFQEWVSFDASFTAVPEPSSTALLGLGGLALLVRRRR